MSPGQSATLRKLRGDLPPTTGSLRGDQPISYDDLERYFTQAEQLYYESGPLLPSPTAVLIQIAEIVIMRHDGSSSSSGNQRSIR